MKFQSTTELSEERTFPKTDISAFFFFGGVGSRFMIFLYLLYFVTQPGKLSSLPVYFVREM